MPPWLILVLVIAVMVLWVAIEAALVTGDRRVFLTALKQFGGVVLVLAALGAVSAGMALLFIRYG